jgi:SsrA-binding protein
MKAQTPRIRNKKARHDYEIVETVEAGLVLEGSEVKALREGKGSLDDAFARVRDGEVFLFNMHIGAYAQAGQFGHDPRRTRKLLLKKREIDRFLGRALEKGFTLIPLTVELGVARGTREFDKREDLKRADAHRDIQRELARRSRGR